MYMSKKALFALLFGTWFALVQVGVVFNGLLAASCLMVLTPVVLGRHPFDDTLF